MVKNTLLKFILSIVLSALLSMHVSKLIFIGVSLSQLSIPIFIVMAFAIWKQSRNLYFYSFFAMAILSILTIKNPDDLSPCIMLFVAMLYRGNIKILMISIASICSAFIINYFYAGYESLHNLPVGIVGNVGVLLFLYFAVIRQPSDITHLARITPLDARQLIILKYLSRDISRKEMPDKVPERELWKHDIDNFTFDIINAEISKIKKVLDLKSEFALGIWYCEKCEISRNTSKT